MNNSGTNEHSVTVGLPVYRLVGPNGEYGGLFHYATHAAAVGERMWPSHQERDENNPGWEVQAIR